MGGLWVRQAKERRTFGERPAAVFSRGTSQSFAEQSAVHSKQNHIALHFLHKPLDPRKWETLGLSMSAEERG